MKNCPSAVKGKYENVKDGKMAKITVQAWCDWELYIWHWFAGRPSTNNDLTLVSASPLINEILLEKFPFNFSTPYEYISDSRGTLLFGRWYLLPVAYFYWSIHHPTNEEASRFTKKQEAHCKDIERVFGVLQAYFRILREYIQLWFIEDIVKVYKYVSSCTI